MSKKKRKVNLKQLSVDEIFSILTFCDTKTFYNFSATCKILNKLVKIKEEIYFRVLYSNNWDKLNGKILDNIEKKDKVNSKTKIWKELFKKRYLCGLKLYEVSNFMNRCLSIQPSFPSAFRRRSFTCRSHRRQAPAPSFSQAHLLPRRA